MWVAASTPIVFGVNAVPNTEEGTTSAIGEKQFANTIGVATAIGCAITVPVTVTGATLSVDFTLILGEEPAEDNEEQAKARL